MKKLSAIIASVLALGTFTATSIAASACGGHRYGHHSYAAAYTPAANAYTPTATANSAARHYFIDINGDGVCDNCGGSVCLTNGLCAGHQSHHVQGYFIDNNGDGICDNCGSGVCLSNGHCSVCYHGYYNGNGYFIDANGDGICDNCANGVCQQHGTGINHHYGRGCHH